MALIKCSECGKEVSTEAGKCPHCGVKVKKPAGPLAWLLGSVIFLVILVGALGKPEPAIDTRLPEQRAAEEKTKQQENRRAMIALGALDTIRNSLRNPASVQWGDILANNDGTTICIGLRAQNGFGGMNKGTYAVINGKITESATAWNKHCANKTLHNMKFVLRMLKSS